jgi:CRISPR-associated protein Cas1
LDSLPVQLTHYKKIPKHWLEFSQRTSSISGGNRHATRPVNALLNYSYSVLAGQVKRTARKKLQTYDGKF